MLTKCIKNDICTTSIAALTFSSHLQTEFWMCCGRGTHTKQELIFVGEMEVKAGGRERRENGI